MRTGTLISGITLFPNQSIPPTVLNLYGRCPTIRAERLKSAKSGGNLLDLYIIGCIEYRATFAATDYQTAVNYCLAQPNREYPGSKEFTEIGKNVPLSDLRLFQIPFDFGSYAN
jgi:hypothetical protein